MTLKKKQTSWEVQWDWEEIEKVKSELSNAYINCEANGEDFCEERSKDQ